MLANRISDKRITSLLGRGGPDDRSPRLSVESVASTWTDAPSASSASGAGAGAAAMREASDSSGGADGSPITIAGVGDEKRVLTTARMASRANSKETPTGNFRTHNTVSDRFGRWIKPILVPFA